MRLFLKAYEKEYYYQDLVIIMESVPYRGMLSPAGSSSPLAEDTCYIVFSTADHTHPEDGCPALR